MHRSGTSLVANWLHNCGLNMGDQLINETFGNANGHFEDLEFHTLHETIFKESGISMGGLSGSLDVQMNAELFEKMKCLVDSKNQQHEEWGWKEPRTCLFLPHYLTILPSANYLILYRDYHLLVDSLVRRDTKKLMDWYSSQGIYSKLRSYFYFKRTLKLKTDMASNYLQTRVHYSRELLNLLKVVPKAKILVMRYEDLLDSGADARTISNSWGFGLSFKPFSEVYKAEMISKNFRSYSWLASNEHEANNVLTELDNYNSFH